MKNVAQRVFTSRYFENNVLTHTTSKDYKLLSLPQFTPKLFLACDTWTWPEQSNLWHSANIYFNDQNSPYALRSSAKE